MKKSLIFRIVLCCVDMSERPDNQRGGKETMNGSAQTGRQARSPPVTRRHGGRSGDEEGTSSHTGPSQIVDPTQQYEQHYEKSRYQKGEAQQEAEPKSYPGRLIDLSLLPNFGRQMACRRKFNCLILIN